MLFQKYVAREESPLTADYLPQYLGQVRRVCRKLITRIASEEFISPLAVSERRAVFEILQAG